MINIIRGNKKGSILTYYILHYNQNHIKKPISEVYNLMDQIKKLFKLFSDNKSSGKRDGVWIQRGNVEVNQDTKLAITVWNINHKKLECMK